MRFSIVLALCGGVAHGDVHKPPVTPTPAIPDFELPVPDAGFLDVRTLRVAGKHHLDREVKVKGYITWIYDCVTENQQPGRTKQQVQQQIDDDPTICERPKFYLGATKDAPAERSIWVVEVPRAPNKLERQRLPKDELARWPAVPKLVVGEHVTVTGEWKVTSPRGEANSDGLLVFKAIAPSQPNTAVKLVRDPTAKLPRALPLKAKPARAGDVDGSRAAHRECLEAYGAQRFETAVERCRKAVALDPANHGGWFSLAVALAKRKAWKPATEAAWEAAQLDPSVAQYHLIHGRFALEEVKHGVREDVARKQARKLEDVVVDFSTTNFDVAQISLQRALAASPDLWLAHYLLGHIHALRGEPTAAAERLTRAVSMSPPESAPYIALVELFRRWDFSQQALAIATAGTKHVVGGIEVSDLWFVLGMCHEDLRDDAAAIAAFTKALDHHPRHAAALFQRGQAYVRKRDYVRAKPDLEAFARTNPTGFYASQVNRLLLELAARKR